MNNELFKRIASSLIFMTLVLSACNMPFDQGTSTATSRSIPKSATSTVSPESPSPTAEVSGAPTVEPTLEALQLALQPPEIRTGNSELDPIIDAVLAHDMPGLRELTEFTVIGCTHAQGLGGPPKCDYGVEEGNLVEVVPFLGPEGHHMDQKTYQEWVGPDALGLLAVYQVSSDTYQSEAYPAGDFALVFLESQGVTVLTMQVRQGRVIRYDYSFSGSLQSDIESKSDEVLIPLTFNPSPTKVPWNQFVDPGGRFEITYPQTLTLRTDPEEDSWKLGEQIQIEVLGPNYSWITCFDKALGDCPFVETDEILQIQGQEVRRVKGYIGAVGGNIPQEFLVYIFGLDDKALALTLYALPFDTELTEFSMIWPLEGMELELFERTVETVIIHQ